MHVCLVPNQPPEPVSLRCQHTIHPSSIDAVESMPTALKEFRIEVTMLRHAYALFSLQPRRGVVVYVPNVLHFDFHFMLGKD